MSIEALKIDRIRRDGGTQPRASLDENTVAEYAEALSEGAIMPPVEVFFDGAEYWLADGFHRVAAFERRGWTEIHATIHQGDRRAAVLHSTGVNGEHGLRRSNADKRRAVETLLRDAEWGRWSDRVIAHQAKVSHTLVAQVRKELSGNSARYDGSPTTYEPAGERIVTVERGGATYEMRVPVPAAAPALPDAVAAAVLSLAHGDRRGMVALLGQIKILSPQGMDILAKVRDRLAETIEPAPRLRDIQAVCAGLWNAALAGVQPPAVGEQAAAAAEEEEELRLGGAPKAQGRCGVCGRPLTNPEHVAQGCGPVCAGHASAGRGNGKGNGAAPSLSGGFVFSSAAGPGPEAAAAAAAAEDDGDWEPDVAEEADPGETSPAALAAIAQQALQIGALKYALRRALAQLERVAARYDEPDADLVEAIVTLSAALSRTVV